MKVSIIGQGYVGLSISFAAALEGHTVIGHDTNSKLIADLKKGATSVPGVNGQKLLDLITRGNFLPTNDFDKLKESEIVILAVPTPLDLDRNPDLTYLTEAAKTVAQCSTKSILLINESTSFPGTLRNVIKPIFDQLSKHSHRFAASPERVDPGNSQWDIRTTPRVISGLTKSATIEAVNFYKTFCDKVFIVDTPEIAEASKIFENTFRQVNIGLVNELSEIAFKLGFSANDAINAAGTKPFGYLPFYPGIGVGGHCIPVDPTYLSYISKQNGIDSKFIDLANTVNENRPKYVAERIKYELGGDLTRKRIQIAGIAYKPNVEDMRESPTPKFIQALRNLGAIVIWYDPLVKEFQGEVSSPVSSNIDLGILSVPHDELDLSLWRESEILVFDVSSGSKTYGWPKLF